MVILFLSSGLFLGWALGANDAANIFGTAVSSRMVRYMTAVILTAIFVILGALMEGINGIKTISTLTSQTMFTAFITALSAAIAITILTILKLPVSTSQALVGGIIGIGIYSNDINFVGFYKILICWIGTPLGSMLIAIFLYFTLSRIIRILNISFIQLDGYLRIGLVISGIYAAYALGANNVANVSGIYLGIINISPIYLSLIGGLSMAIGVLTYSRNVIYTVGRKLVPLDAFSAFIAILSEAITVHIYAKIGVPVSTSQAIIGAVIGIGIYKGMRTINLKTLSTITIGWCATPVIAAVLSYFMIFISRL